MDLDTLLATPNGAHFRRADLHIHSFGASGDVKDTTMTPEAIVDTAARERLDVIALTDHNSIRNVERALEHARRHLLLVLPGVELTTTQGHLLLYFPTLDQLTRAFGQLEFAPSHEYCSNSIEHCLQIAARFGGIGIAAHIELDSGFEQRIPGSTPVKSGFLRQPNLVALEVSAIGSRDWYTAADPDVSRAHLAKERRQALLRTCDLPKVMNSDAHSLAQLGRNAAGDRRLTRIKMDELTFEAFRIGMIEGDVRCRLEDELPSTFPHIVGIHFEGGFLEDQLIHFSRNLTCIIGGRGSGKSTALEGVRVGCGSHGRESVVDSDVWADRITVWYRDEAGAIQTLVRNCDSEVMNVTEADGLTRIPVEGYGQGETAETIQHCGKEPGVLLEFLDRFINLSEEIQNDETIRRELDTSQVLIRDLASAVAGLPRYRELRTDASHKLERLKNEHAQEVIELEESIARERAYCVELESLVADMMASATTVDIELFEYVTTQVDDALVRVGGDELQQIRATCQSLKAEVQAESAAWRTRRAEFARQIKLHVARWREKENAARSRIEGKRKELEALGVRLDMAFIRRLTTSASDYGRKIRELEQKEVRLKEARLHRRTLVRRRLEVRSQIFAKRTALAITLTRNLTTGSDNDFKVTLKFREGNLSPECARIVTEAMQWRTSRVPRADMLVEQLSVPGLLTALAKADASAFGKVVDGTGTPLFSVSDQQALLECLRRGEVVAQLEACAYEDRPEITVRATVVLPGGGIREVPRDFSKLSLGQQQSIVLSMLLFSESSDPLIIDQPEDNLDSLFIARVLVANLRKIKEKRQVIMVTHNANIAVLADAELIVPLRATSERSTIADRGSIDTAATQKYVCRILEGGDDAFRRRGEIYGFLHAPPGPSR